LRSAETARAGASAFIELEVRGGLAPSELEDLRYGAIFHDIGKIAIPDAVLNKPAPLSAEERTAIERHPVIGEGIVAPIPFLSDQVRSIVRHGHEHWDGSGYPDGLRGEDIPLGARIVLVVDAYHAMVSDRSYRRGMPDADARRELSANAGTQFDRRVVGAFLRVLDARDASTADGA
jgi:HD-GYP domain-containing protein (c-di-GMP phosphodiesterase class II)